MDIKQGQENAKLVKEEEEKTTNYIFQKNLKTKMAFYFILGILVLIIFGIALSGWIFETP